MPSRLACRAIGAISSCMAEVFTSGTDDGLNVAFARLALYSVRLSTERASRRIPTSKTDFL